MEDETSRLKSLIPRVKSGDEDAAKQLIELLYPRVIRIVRANLPFATEEQDLSQEIFMKIFAKIDQYKGAKEITHWVSRIAVNTCYDQLRLQRANRELRFADLSPSQEEFLQQTLADSSIDNNLPTAEPSGLAKECIEQLLATLNPTEQIVIRMLDMEQRSVAEIAKMTSWGASKIKVTAMRARRKLRKKLDHLEKRHVRKN